MNKAKKKTYNYEVTYKGTYEELFDIYSSLRKEESKTCIIRLLECAILAPTSGHNGVAAISNAKLTVIIMLGTLLSELDRFTKKNMSLQHDAQFSETEKLEAQRAAKILFVSGKILSLIDNYTECDDFFEEAARIMKAASPMFKIKLINESIAERDTRGLMP